MADDSPNDADQDPAPPRRGPPGRGHPALRPGDDRRPLISRPGFPKGGSALQGRGSHLGPPPSAATSASSGPSPRTDPRQGFGLYPAPTPPPTLAPAPGPYGGRGRARGGFGIRRGDCSRPFRGSRPAYPPSLPPPIEAPTQQRPDPSPWPELPRPTNGLGPTSAPAHGGAFAPPHSTAPAPLGRPTAPAAEDLPALPEAPEFEWYGGLTSEQQAEYFQVLRREQEVARRLADLQRRWPQLLDPLAPPP
eukprot:EG_transcript_24377